MYTRGLRRQDQHAARDVCGRYVPRWNVGGHGPCECAWEGGHPQYCHRDDALEQEDWPRRMVGKKLEKSAKRQLEHARVTGGSGGVETLGGD
jgi:hypothetical protein